MSQKESTPADPQTPPLDLEKQSAQSMKALGTFGEKIKPWLFAFGNWIFGGLIAFNLIVVGALITVGPAVYISPGIQIADQGFNFILSDISGQFKSERFNTRLCTGFPLHAHVLVRSRVITDQYRC